MALQILTPSVGNLVQGSIPMLLIVNALAITDNSNHDLTQVADQTAMFGADVRCQPGRKVLYVASTLDQAVNITLMGAVDSSAAANFKIVGSAASVSSGTTKFLTVADLALINEPFPFMSVRAACGTGPGSGTLTIYLCAASV